MPKLRREKQLTSKVRKEKGAHYTPDEFADFVAEQIASHLPRKPKSLHVLDPAVGDGALLQAIANKLGAPNHYSGFDIDQPALEHAETLLANSLAANAFTLHHEDFLSRFGETDLFNVGTPVEYDVAISNPPYVRTQVLGAAASQKLAATFGHTGRVDLYFAFLASISLSLKPGGVAGIIVSNRFMTTKAGAQVRAGLLHDFEILHVWDFGDTKIFEAAVLPVVLILRKKAKPGQEADPGKFSSIYTTNEPADQFASTIYEALKMSGPVQVGPITFLVKHGTLETNQGTDVWRIASKEDDEWLDTVRRHTFKTFGQLGKIRVGVKTTADNVFIKDWSETPPNQRPELLRPLITHHVASRYLANTAKGSKEILYTHEIREGKRRVVEMNNYPVSKKYLESHREQLEGRRYVIEANRAWFEIWVPQNPASWNQPKLIFTDISERATCWIDTTGAIVNGDCYWMIPTDPKEENLLWLALAVGNSNFIEEFYDHKFANKLYSGRRRFMTQYVEQFPIPDPTIAESKELVKLAKTIHRLKATKDTSKLEAECDSLVKKAFGVSLEEVTR